ncbi:helix-turn-helix domain-containing protein [Cerasicoccus maritimus]|uniref:helix-turn-helix domain-containing protein n=1 Tax=Cerasicoccus maritimus TaxID=490089 RepID=UPI0028526C5B|nr:helix-turn-helix domain-containing protein [Cerasicoccus maritimus]
MKSDLSLEKQLSDNTDQTQAWIKELEIRRNPPAQMTVPEAAIYIGISERKLREDIGKRQFKSIRIGNRVILRAKDIDAALEAMTQ